MGKSPRIQVSLDPEVYKDLRTIARLGDKSMSAILADMVEGAAPTLRQIADTMEQLHRLQARLPGATAQEIAGHFDMAAWKVSGGVDELQDHLDQVQNRLGHVEATEPPRPSEGGERGGSGASSKQKPEGAQPPYINKGVKRDPRG